ncbi:MAG TPA: hypothetical protein VL094_06845 [Sphingomonadaceae bacterium]|nr:hypothetical protein [Sphingomonadaceae bacterium]
MCVETGRWRAMPEMVAGNGNFAGLQGAAGEAERVCGNQIARPLAGILRRRPPRHRNTAYWLRRSDGAKASHFGINLYAARIISREKYVSQGIHRYIDRSGYEGILRGGVCALGCSSAGRVSQRQTCPVTAC